MKKTLIVLIALMVVLVAIFLIGRSNEECNHAHSQRVEQKQEGPHIAMTKPVSPSIKEESPVKSPVRRDLIRAKKEIWAEKMTSGRPEAYQKVLDAPTPPHLHLAPAKELVLVNPIDAEKVNFEIKQTPAQNLIIDGISCKDSEYAYSRNNDLIVLGGARDDDKKLIRMRNETIGNTIEILPKFNFNEKRRWYIESWNWMTITELLGFSQEEDGKAEGIVMSHFYSYEYTTKSLCTLTLPQEINPYQPLDIKGINCGARMLKISDEGGNTYYLRY
jgi:hypothetical protein